MQILEHSISRVSVLKTLKMHTLIYLVATVLNHHPLDVCFLRVGHTIFTPFSVLESDYFQFYFGKLIMLVGTSAMLLRPRGGGGGGTPI